VRQRAVARKELIVADLENPTLSEGLQETVRERLLSQKEEILRLYRKDLKAGQDASAESGEDLVDRANLAQNRELMFSLSGTEREALIEIDEALARLSEGNYGVCVSCEAEIGPGRLDVMPSARYCIDCQELKEQGRLL
jgi:DnaK suppressor protein